MMLWSWKLKDAASLIPIRITDSPYSALAEQVLLALPVNGMKYLPHDFSEEFAL